MQLIKLLVTALMWHKAIAIGIFTFTDKSDPGKFVSHEYKFPIIAYYVHEKLEDAFHQDFIFLGDETGCEPYKDHHANNKIVAIQGILINIFQYISF